MWYKLTGGSIKCCAMYQVTTSALHCQLNLSSRAERESTRYLKTGNRIKLEITTTDSFRRSLVFRTRLAIPQL